MDKKHEQPDVKTPVVLFKPFIGAQEELFRAPVGPKCFLIRGKGW